MEDEVRRFRNALGEFVTGVTVITTCDATGQPFGLTANSFASLSLSPPLVLWNLGDHADCYRVFKAAEHFAIHVLHHGQSAVSNRFATKGDDKFASLEWSAGVCGSPVLNDYAMLFECRTEAVHPGGDHLIMVGRVERFDSGAEGSPLLYYRGGYRGLDAGPDDPPAPR
ncbi:MAG: flavin reductase family protein [Gammaproteobacteria bacterium]|nr:flavin reductase family protein [Gammaproteobacteria bacterium]